MRLADQMELVNSYRFYAFILKIEMHYAPRRDSAFDQLPHALVCHKGLARATHPLYYRCKGSLFIILDIAMNDHFRQSILIKFCQYGLYGIFHVAYCTKTAPTRQVFGSKIEPKAMMV